MIRKLLARTLQRDQPSVERPITIDQTQLIALREAASELQMLQLREGAGRLPNLEERVTAAWANLAVEEPDLRLDEARQLLVGHC